MAITKADLAISLHDELGLNKRESKEFVEQFFEIPISARRVVTFKASQKLKESVEKNAAALKQLFT